MFSPSEYRIDSRITSRPVTIAVIGCGGTGGFVADGLCRMLSQYCHLLLIDHDRVEEHNLRRQLFYPQDLGKFKSQALAERLARLYGVAITYSVRPYEGSNPHLLIGAVDNAAARRAIAEKHHGWWLDAGNGKNSGQALIGNKPDREYLRGAFNAATGICNALPFPSIQMPELLIAVPGEMQPRDCAERVQANEQSPVINLMMAGLVLEMVRRLLAGTLTWMGVTLDLEVGTMRPIEAYPGVVARMVGVNVNQLVVEKEIVRRW